MKYILVENMWNPAKLLRDEIQKLTGIRLGVTNSVNQRDIVIRYGNSKGYSTTEFNSNKKIGLFGNKYSFSIASKKYGFLSPQFNFNGLPTIFPILIRTTLNGSGGEGIIICKTLEEFNSNWREGYHWTPYIKTIAEYRVHMLGGKIARIFKKERDENLEREEIPIRNNSRGYHFSLKNTEVFPKLIEAATAFDKVLGAKFYALDVGWNKENFIFFEANTAPGLNEFTADLYAKYLSSELFGWHE
jgi:glutathione synthase/RimK-type ligase-like ATP-grasp enzyme